MRTYFAFLFARIYLAYSILMLVLFPARDRFVHPRKAKLRPAVKPLT